MRILTAIVLISLIAIGFGFKKPKIIRYSSAICFTFYGLLAIPLLFLGTDALMPAPLAVSSGILVMVLLGFALACIATGLGLFWRSIVARKAAFVMTLVLAFAGIIIDVGIAWRGRMSNELLFQTLTMAVALLFMAWSLNSSLVRNHFESSENDALTGPNHWLASAPKNRRLTPNHHRRKAGRRDLKAQPVDK